MIKTAVDTSAPWAWECYYHTERCVPIATCGRGIPCGACKWSCDRKLQGLWQRDLSTFWSFWEHEVQEYSLWSLHLKIWPGLILNKYCILWICSKCNIFFVTFVWFLIRFQCVRFQCFSVSQMKENKFLIKFVIYYLWVEIIPWELWSN